MRYLPPVYSPLSIGTICVAAMAVGIGRGAKLSAVAEAALERLYPGYRVVLLNSGTNALTEALRLSTTCRTARSGIAPLVALPAYACPDLATAAVGADARITLFDIDPATLEPDLATVEACLRRGAQVVVAAHLYGRVSDLRELRALTEAYGAVLVEDAAQHAGGHAAGVRGGAQAALSVLSFGRGKGLNAGGGGALLERRSHGDGRAVSAPASGSWRSLATSLVTESLSHPLIYGVPVRLAALAIGETRYHDPRATMAMPQGLTHLLTRALQAEEGELTRRRALESRYYRELESLRRPDVVLFPFAPGSGALRTPVALDPARAAQQRSRLARLGVVRSYPRTLADYPEIAGRMLEPPGTTPGAAYLAERLHTLPTHASVLDRDVRAIVRMLASEAD